MAVKALNPKAEVARAQAALAVNISAARGLQDVLRTNLGPKGTMKMWGNLPARVWGGGGGGRRLSARAAVTAWGEAWGERPGGGCARVRPGRRSYRRHTGEGGTKAEAARPGGAEWIEKESVRAYGRTRVAGPGSGGGCVCWWPASCRPQAGIGGWRHQADQRWQRAAAGNGELVLAFAGVGILGEPGMGGLRQEPAGIGLECLWRRGDRVRYCPRPVFLWYLPLCVEGKMSLGRKVKKCVQHGGRWKNFVC